MLKSVIVVFTFVFLASIDPLPAAVSPPYYGNGVSDMSGFVGNGNLSFSDNGSRVRGTFNLGSAFTPQDYLVFYIDSRPGGFADTSGFIENGNPFKASASGLSYSGVRSLATFAPGFTADYAIVLQHQSSAFLFELAAGTEFPMQKTLVFNEVGNTWTFDFYLSDVGASGNHFDFQSVVARSFGNGSHSLESFETLQGTGGFNPITFDYFNSYGVEPVPEPANVALAVFGGLGVLWSVGGKVRQVWARKVPN
jgi:hypothetical protein